MHGEGIAILIFIVLGSGLVINVALLISNIVLYRSWKKIKKQVLK